ncbi:MAG: BatA domain-containing protein, partial [Planctomycetota bacterium]|nr:BatA domain-containing protein [Planctomycetota bacterium]
MNPFLHMPMAWAALGLTSIPIIIHLINRRRLRQMDWAAMEFLLLALRKNRRRIRLEQLILLLCRVALMALLALFLARPLLSDKRFSWLGDALRSEEKIFVIDDSLSMDQRQADRSLLSRATAAVVESMARLVETGTRDRLTVVRTSRPDKPLVRAGIIDKGRVAGLSSALKQLGATSTRMDLGRSLEGIAEYAAAKGAESPMRSRAVSIITDLRAADWTDGGSGPNPAILAAMERLLQSEEVDTRFVILDVGTESTANVAITGLDLEGGRPTVDLASEIRVKVKNFGPRPVRDVQVRLSYAPVTQGLKDPSMTLAPTISEIGPGETAVASVRCTFRTPGQYWATAEISGSGDPLGRDNSSSIVLSVVEFTKVLVVSGEPSSERFEGETDYLVAALNPSGEVPSGFTAEVVIEDNLPRGELADFGAIFLANVYELPGEFLNRVGRYVRDGGPLIIFLGDQIDPGVYARDLGTAAGPVGEQFPGRGLLPAKIGKMVNHDEAPVGLAPAYESAYFQFLKDGGEPLVELISFQRYFKLEPSETTHVLATYDDGEESPAFVEMSVEAGRVLLLASSADDEWNDWPRTQTYLMVLHQMLERIGRTRGRVPVYSAGAVVEVPVDITVYRNDDIRYRGPDPTIPEKPLIASGSADDPADIRLRIDDTYQAGLSFLTLEKRSGEQETRAFAVRSAPEESDLRRVSEDELHALYPEIPLTVVRDSARFSESGRGRFEISDILLALFVILLFVEGTLACWFARHKKRLSVAAAELAR